MTHVLLLTNKHNYIPLVKLLTGDILTTLGRLVDVIGTRAGPPFFFSPSLGSDKLTCCLLYSPPLLR